MSVGPTTERPWSLEGLMSLRVMLATGAKLDAIADALGRMKGECNLASDALIGRTPEQALKRLNAGARARPEPERPPSRGLARFLREVFT
jgi:hypothetical protein